MTSINPATWTPPMCANGPHTPNSDRWQNNILRLIDGRWICHGCWTVGGILPDDDEPEPC